MLKSKVEKLFIKNLIFINNDNIVDKIKNNNNFDNVKSEIKLAKCKNTV